MGLQVVPVDSIAFPDTVCYGDTLNIAFWSGALEDKPEFSHFEIEANPGRLGITAWARVYEWVGGGSMPPVDQVVLKGDLCRIFPPLSFGSVEIAVGQPDGSLFADTVIVEPCDRLVYSCSFESELEIADWSIPGDYEITDDVPPGGGYSSICVSGIDIVPHAYYLIAPADQDGHYIFSCWAKAEQPGLILLRFSEEESIELCVKATEWARYESPDTLFCPAGEQLLIGLTGDFHPTRPSGTLYVDLLEVWRLAR